MGYNKAATNVFEATIGDRRISEDRKGSLSRCGAIARGAAAMASPEAQAFFEKMKHELALSSIGSHEIKAGDRSRDIVVSVRFPVIFNGEAHTHKLQLSKNGRWAPEQIGVQAIDIGKDKQTKDFCVKIAKKVHKITGITDYGYTKNGNPIVPEDMILKQVREMLKPDIKAAADRLIVESNTMLLDPTFQVEARTAYEDVIRERVHEALQEYESVGPEALHRFVDELYCKKIHDE